MENQNTWNAATKLINDAINTWQNNQIKGYFGYSLPRHIYNCLETHGFIKDQESKEETET